MRAVFASGQSTRRDSHCISSALSRTSRTARWDVTSPFAWDGEPECSVESSCLNSGRYAPARSECGADQLGELDERHGRQGEGEDQCPFAQGVGRDVEDGTGEGE